MEWVLRIEFGFQTWLNGGASRIVPCGEQSVVGFSN